MESFKNEEREEAARAQDFLEMQERTCPACGALARRGQAHFCATCGRSLTEGAYLPADALRASYHLQHRQAALHQRMNIKNRIRSFSAKFPTPNRNNASQTALAFVTYALVPYLGILFCPGAVLMGGIGLVRSWRVPDVGGRRASYAGVVFGVMILGVQIFLWWILYKMPHWAQANAF
jgi:hypothetical protein